MYNTRTGLLLIISTLFLTVNSYSQYDDVPEKTAKTYNNSGGIDYQFVGSNSVDIGLTYRRFFKESKYNLKASFYFGGTNQLYRDSDMLIYPTSDSSQIGVLSNNGYSSNHQRLEIGLEKRLKFRKINLIGGADVLVGHRSSYSNDRVVEGYEEEIEQNGITYKRYSSFHSDSGFINDINFLQTTRNHFTFGLGINLGILVDITPRLYATAFIGLKFTGDALIKESFEYKNELYKEHLPTSQSVSTFNFDQNLSLGLHYRF